MNPDKTAWDSNLLRQVTAEEIVRPPGFYTAIALDTLTVLSAAGSGLAYRFYLENDANIVWGVLLFAVFAILSSLGMLLTKSFWRRLIVITLSFAAISVFFFYLPIWFLLISVVVALGLVIWGEIASRSELNSNLNIRFFRVVRPYLGKTITAAAMLAVIFYLPQARIESIVSPSLFDALYRSLSGTAAFLYPEIKLSSSAEDFASSIARFKLEANTLFLQLLPPARERALKEATAQTLSALNEWLGFEAAPQASMKSLLYRWALKNLEEWREKFGGKLLIIWGIIIFLILRLVGGGLHLLLALTAFLVYQFLLTANIIKIVGESRVQEKIEYS